jgi:hypothetical protein
MEKRVRVFSTRRADNLEYIINIFLKNNEGKLHNIEFSANDYENGSSYSAMIVYTPDDDNDE